MAKISAVILTKNEHSNISECIKSVLFCDEILIIDDNSSDNTVEIATGLGAHVVVKSLEGNFAAQNNFAMNVAKFNWLLYVDADERVSSELQQEITDRIESAEYTGYLAKRYDFIWGKKLTHGEIGAYNSVRLLKKGSGTWVRRVHQQFDSKSSIGQLDNPIIHYPHKTLRKFIDNLDYWSNLHAIANIEEGKRSSLVKIILFPPMHFIKNFIIRFGFLDGMEGFVVAAMMSFHSYLAWSKMFLLERTQGNNE